MTYAVIQFGGHQHKVQEGEQLTFNHVEAEPGATLTVEDVLLVANDKEVMVGTPTVAKAKVTLKVVSHQKGEKIRVATYKAKSRHRRVHGHRQALTTVEVVKIAA